MTRPVTGSPERESLVDRIRTHLAGEATTREVTMFGARAFMVNGSMVVAAQRAGDLLVHIDPARSPELLARPGAEQAEMGAGRTMGPGWVSVAREAIDTEERLASWIDAAMDYNTLSR